MRSIHTIGGKSTLLAWGRTMQASKDNERLLVNSAQLCTMRASPHLTITSSAHLSFMHQHSYTGITFAGLGDPLLRSDFLFESIEEIKVRRHGIPIRVHTNGKHHGIKTIPGGAWFRHGHYGTNGSYPLFGTFKYILSKHVSICSVFFLK